MAPYGDPVQACPNGCNLVHFSTHQASCPLASPNPRRELLASILLEHPRPGINPCLCGGMRLGESYPHHVADALIKAGL